MKSANEIIQIGLLGTFLTVLYSGNVLSDQVIADDLIVQFSTCSGNDCVNGESFGFDTLRLKENNLRINFDDTSASASFPANDWRIVINDTSNGGASYFAIEDSTAGRIPFKVEAGAPSNALIVESSSGDIGIGTAAPVLEVHIVDGDSPGIRIEQDGSSGFTTQTWDVAGNEANFFVRDVTNGSLLPFKIKPSAPNNSLFVNTNGAIGLGTASPSARLDIISTSGKADINLKSSNSTNTPNWTIANNFDELRFSIPGSGAVEASLNNLGNFTTLGTIAPSDFLLRGDSVDWRIINNFDTLRFSIPGSGTVEAQLDASGNLAISGTLTQGSSRTYKTNILPIDVDSIIAKLANLPMATWSYLNNTEVQHIGPMAEDFYAAFEFGADEKHIAPGDMAAIALITAKKLNEDTVSLSEKVQQKDAEISELKSQLADLLIRMNKLESNK
ncbi:tail fiber domain-containing protein [Aliiglaciecola sp. NS0011-25]|uniref:tail fiber domain-containing protein n=1 Tax=Aliiglaciecola sp. NS0011-25 TaxID=3127654 RepID=UPI003103E444